MPKCASGALDRSPRLPLSPAGLAELFADPKRLFARKASRASRQRKKRRQFLALLIRVTPARGRAEIAAMLRGGSFSNVPTASPRPRAKLFRFVRPRAERSC